MRRADYESRMIQILKDSGEFLTARQITEQMVSRFGTMAPNPNQISIMLIPFVRDGLVESEQKQVKQFRWIDTS